MQTMNALNIMDKRGLGHVMRSVPRQRGCMSVSASSKQNKTVRMPKLPATPAQQSAKPSTDAIVARLERNASSGSLDTEVQEQAPVALPTDDPAKWLAWELLPARYKMLVAMSVAFIVCNMDKVNISVAIIPMATEFGWSASTSGLIQSAFFFGYMLSQIPGGYLSSRFGGRLVLPAGVGLWSAATAGVPLLAGTLPGLCVSRAAVGLGEGVAPSAATDIVARSIDKNERSRAISFIFGGLHIGSLIGLLAAPPIIEAFGWPSVFYLFGGLGLLWCVWWERLLPSIGEQEPELVAALGRPADSAAAGAVPEDIPWRAILRQRPFWALAFTHFVNNWFHYSFMAWLPTYFTDSLSVDLTHAAQLSLIPPMAALLVATVAGTSADLLIEKGVDTALIRKGAQCLAFLTPAACLSAAMFVESGPAAVALITASLGMASFSLAGLYSNHADLSTKYASFMLGLTNTAGALPGIIGVAATGLILDHTDSWTLALFAPSIGFFVAGAAVFTAFGSTEPLDLSDNSPFPLEEKLQLDRFRKWFKQE